MFKGVSASVGEEVRVVVLCCFHDDSLVLKGSPACACLHKHFCVRTQSFSHKSTHG